jgi:anaerobic magnesium-protoporphyrin IX monomethyl ester cyclase
MNVLIANPAFRRPLPDGLERYMLGSGMRFPLALLKRSAERPRYVTFPLFLAYAAALLEDAGFHVSVIDGVPLNLTEEEFLRDAVASRPDVIVLEPNTAVIDDALRFSSSLKVMTGARIVLAGAHVSVFAAEILENHRDVDFALVGEYERICLGLLDALRGGASPQTVAGVAYRNEDGCVCVNRPAPLIEPLDRLPFPARHLFPRNSEPSIGAYYDGLFQHSPTAFMHSSRGCPHRCSFCAWVQVLYRGEPQRWFSPERIVDEMLLLVNRFGAKEIYFDDDNFTSNAHRVRELCAEMKRRRVSVAWSAMGDAIGLNQDLLECMADAGCVGLKLGLDSADPGVLRAVKKPLKVRRLDGLVDTAARLGIKTHLSAVFGLTGETKASMKTTFELACALDIDSVQFSVATPCPGTDFHQGLAAEGRLRPARWEEYDGVNMSVVRYEDFSGEYLERFTSEAHTRWLRRKLREPTWVLRQARYLFRLARGQGTRGLSRRLRRAWRLFIGDTVAIANPQVARWMRW